MQDPLYGTFRESLIAQASNIRTKFKKKKRKEEQMRCPSLSSSISSPVTGFKWSDAGYETLIYPIINVNTEISIF